MKGPIFMVSFKDAYSIVLNSVIQLDRETVPLESCLGRITARDVFSDIEIPPFNKSAMDGYAYCSDDVSPEFKVVEIVPAGSFPTKKISHGECSKIMTGAQIPEGADSVVRVENTTESSGIMKIVFKDISTNICYRGEDIHAGDIVVQRGTIITPQIMGILASVGCAVVEVAKKPIVGIIATGKELVAPGEKVGPAQIRNSNSYQLAGQIIRCSAEPRLYGIAGDNEDDITKKFTMACEECDIVLLSGGVSMGDLDLVPGILKKRGVEFKFEKIAVKPGKPTVFGLRGKTYVFGLAGNPVSTFVIFELLVRPLIESISGLKLVPRLIRGILAADVRSKPSKRTMFIPVFIDAENSVMPVKYHGSAHLNAYSYANGILEIQQLATLKKGDSVYVRQL